VQDAKSIMTYEHVNMVVISDGLTFQRVKRISNGLAVLPIIDPNWMLSWFCVLPVVWWPKEHDVILSVLHVYTV